MNYLQVSFFFLFFFSLLLLSTEVLLREHLSPLALFHMKKFHGEWKTLFSLLLVTGTFILLAYHLCVVKKQTQASVSMRKASFFSLARKRRGEEEAVFSYIFKDVDRYNYMNAQRLVEQVQGSPSKSLRKMHRSHSGHQRKRVLASQHLAPCQRALIALMTASEKKKRREERKRMRQRDKESLHEWLLRKNKERTRVKRNRLDERQRD